MYAIWFVLEKNDTEYFANIIDDLSAKYDAQPFQPHITAYGLVDISLDKLDEIVRNSIKDQKQFVIKKSNISYSDVFWKTLYVEFQPNVQLTKIGEKLTASLQSYASYDFIPHVSLIYKNMAISEQKKLADTIEIKENFTVTQMWIQQFHEDITKWTIVKKYELD